MWQRVVANASGEALIPWAGANSPSNRSIKLDHSRAQAFSLSRKICMPHFPIMSTIANIVITHVDGEYRIQIGDDSGDTAVYVPSPIKLSISPSCSTIFSVTRTRSKPRVKAPGIYL
jgi:hypothetical protein